MVLWICFDLQAVIEAGDGINWTRYTGFGKEAVAAQLLQAGASVCAVNDNNSTPLHTAALHGKSSIANLLLQANASPTAVNKDGRTPAQYAKQRGHGVLAAMLLEAEQAAALSESGFRWSPFHFIRRETFFNPLCVAVDWF